MKRKPRKLVLSRETLRTLEDRSLRNVDGGTGPSYACDTDLDCSTHCIVPTYVGYACG